MQPLPISVDRYFFTRFCVESNPDHVQAENQRIEGKFDSELKVSKVPGSTNVYVAEQHVKFDANSNTSIPYSLDVVCIGFFKVEDSSLGEEDIQHGVTNLAHSVLYASIRDAVLAATARQPWGPFSIGVAILEQRKDTAMPATTKRGVAKGSRRKTSSK